MVWRAKWLCIITINWRGVSSLGGYEKKLQKMVKQGGFRLLSRMKQTPAILTFQEILLHANTLSEKVWVERRDQLKQSLVGDRAQNQKWRFANIMKWELDIWDSEIKPHRKHVIFTQLSLVSKENYHPWGTHFTYLLLLCLKVVGSPAHVITFAL